MLLRRCGLLVLVVLMLILLLLMVKGAAVLIFPDVGLGAHVVVGDVWGVWIWQSEGIGIHVEHEVRISGV